MSLIAQKIIETRKQKGLTQEELAEQAHINIRTIQRIENCESEPRGKTLRLICNVLEIEIQELLDVKNESNGIATRVIEGFFILTLNLILMSIIGFLTLDSNANINSRFGALLLSFFIPFFIVVFTKSIGQIERILKFGSGFMIYSILVMIMHGFPIGFTTGLFPCSLIALVVLYYANGLVTKLALHKRQDFGWKE